MDLNISIKKYYTTIFPVEELFSTYNITDTREISFCTQQGSYLRYLHFTDSAVFKEKICSIVPIKIDIGAIFSAKPSKLGSSKPVAKELVFDIDLTDYPRKCCEGKTICKICYVKIKCTIKLLEYILREELGFEEIGYVFSGRRGLHCWVFDNINLSSVIRNEIYKYFQTIIDKNLEIKEYINIISNFTESPNINEWFVRLDKAVSTDIGHLCKIPFSVHPESLKISVPIDPENIPELEDLPTLETFIENPKKIQYYTNIMKSWRI